MKNLSKTFILCSALFSFTILPITDCFAVEIASTEGNSYLTFMDEPPFLDIFTFEEGGNSFSMEMSEAKLSGTGTYTNMEVLFSAEWASTDESTTYTLTGISIAGIVILGFGEKTADSDNDTIHFVGVLNSLFPD